MGDTHPFSEERYRETVSRTFLMRRVLSYTALSRDLTLLRYTLCMDMAGCCPTSVLMDVVHKLLETKKRRTLHANGNCSL